MSKRKAPSPGNSPSISLKKRAIADELDNPNSFMDNYMQLYETHQNDPKKRQEVFQMAVNQENIYREYFAQDRENKILDEKYLFVYDVFKHRDLFNFVEEDEEEVKIPRLSTIEVEKKKGSSVVTKENFERNFSLFTENQLSGMDWNNVFAAGGSVLACLQPVPEPHNENNIAIRNYYHKNAYKTSDIDLFIYGLNEEEANKKMAHIFDVIKNNLIGGEDVIAFRSLHAVTIISKFPYRHTQIVLRLYKSPAEVLMGFDVDSCAVGYDGNSVYVSPRAHHALTYQVNTVDMTRRSPSYEMRLAKYCTRGFSVLIPSLDLERVDPLIFEKRFDQVQGLAKLLLLTKLEKQVFRFRYKEQQRLRKLRPEVQSNDIIATKMMDDEDYNAERLEGGESASDYSTVFLPWGPKWSAVRIRKLMYTKDMILNSKWYDPKKKYHTHPCFFGTIDEIIKDCCGNCPPIPPEDVDPDSAYVSGVLTWVTVNPGQQTVVQRIGSFHPITEGDWTEGAYISVTTEELFSAVNANKVAKLQEILKQQDPAINLETRDASGRTALHLAIMSDAVECAELLLKNGARISTRMIDGRTAVHLCAQYNRAKILQLIIERGAELEDIKTRKAEEKKQEMEVEKEEEKEEEEEVEEEEEEENEDDEEVDAEFSIKAMLDKKKQDLKKEMEDNDPNSVEGEDTLEIEAHDWDYQLSALQYAAFFGNDEVIDVLVNEGGADLKTLSKNGLTIVMIAMVNSHTSTVDLLIKLGHPVNHMDSNRRNALHYLCTLETPSIPILDVLVKHGINVNATCNSKETPLLIALKQYSRGNNNRGRQKRVPRIRHRNSNKQKNEDDEKEDVLAKEKLEVIEDEKYQFIKHLVRNKAKFIFTYDDIKALENFNAVPEKNDDEDEDEDEDEDGSEDEAPAPPPPKLGKGGGGLRSRGRVNYKFNNNNNNNSKEDWYYTEINFDSPIKIALEMRSVRLVKLFLRNGVNVNTMKSRYHTLLDYVEDLDSYDEDNDINKDLKNANFASIHYSQNFSVSQCRTFLKQLQSNFAKQKGVSKWQYLLAHRALTQLAKGFFYEKNRHKTRFNDTIKPIYAKKVCSEQFKALKALLISKGAVRFTQLRLATPQAVTDQTYKKNYPDQVKLSSHNRGYGYRNNNNQEITFPDFINNFKFSCNYMEGAIPQNAASIDNMILAILKNDISGLEAATIKSKKPALICCNIVTQGYGNSSCSSLDLAISSQSPKDSEALIKAILEIAKAQYTPKQAKAKEKDVASINNYSLTAMMNQRVKPKHFLNSDNTMDDDDDEEMVDPNQLVVSKALSHSGPMDLILSNSNGNCLHYAAHFNNLPAAKYIINYINENFEKPREVIEKLLFEKLSGTCTPLNVAVSNGHIEIAEFFLQYGGGIKPVVEEFEYVGLDVGGRKMDWVKEHVNQENRPASPLFVAAKFDQIEMLDFLGNKAHGIWKAQFLKQFPDTTEDDYQMPFEFNLNFQYSNGGIMHFAGLKAMKKLIELDESLISVLDSNGYAPLHRAVINQKLDVVQLLLEHGASITLASKKGWNAIHWAATTDNLEILELLLSEATPAEVNRTTLRSETPLFIACSKEASDKVIELLLKFGADPLIADVTGDLPLHIAIKNSNLHCVETLLKSIHDVYASENGVGYTPFDYSLVNLVSTFFHQNATVSTQNKILSTLKERLRNLKRGRASSKAIQSVTETMLKLAIDTVNKEMKKNRNRYGYDEDDDDDDDDYNNRFNISKPDYKSYSLPDSLPSVEDILSKVIELSASDVPEVIDDTEHASDNEAPLIDTPKATPLPSSSTSGVIKGNQYSYILYPVKTATKISDFVKSAKVANWAVGNGFYPAGSKSEKVDKKEIVLVSKSNPSTCIDDQKKVFAELKIDSNSKICEYSSSKYTIYLQSTSYTRKLLANSNLLVRQ